MGDKERLPEGAEALPAGELKGRALRGGLAKAGSQAAGLALRVGSLMLLARLLTPADFGLVGMVTVATGIFSLMKDAGLSAATVQRAAITHRQVSTLFWVNVAVGIAMWLMLLAAAPALVRFYEEPRLFKLTAVLAFGFVINAAGVQHSALLQRQMRFATLAGIDTAAQVSSIAVGVVMALAGWEYWALVGMALTPPAVSTVGYWVASGWRPGLPARNTEIGSMVRFGGAVTLNSLVIYVAYNADKLLLGRVWGAAALGIYGRAYQLLNIPTDTLNSSVGGVAVSALSRLQDDPARHRHYFLRAYSLVVALTIPVTIACALFADDIVLVLLGPRWVEATSIFRLLAPTTLCFAMLNPLWWLLVSTGRVKRSIHIALVMAPLLIVAYAVGLPYGPRGMAMCYSAMMMLMTVPMVAWATHGQAVRLGDIGRAVLPAVASSAVATAASTAVGYAVSDLSPTFLRLFVEGLVLVATYAGMLLFGTGQRAVYSDLLVSMRDSVIGRRSVRAETPAL